MPRRRFVTLVTMLTLALPGAAGAQSAGDEEYQNPITAPEPAAPQPERPASEAPPAAPARAEPAPAAQPQAAAPATELPRTGLPAALIGAAGALLLAGGAGLRRRV